MVRFTALALIVLAGCARAIPHAVTLGGDVSRPTEPAPVTPVSSQSAWLASHVVFEGNEKVSRADLLSVMHPHADGPYPSQYELEKDLVLLTSLYYDRGYVLARIDQPALEGDKVRFRIDEGSRFRIGTIVVHDIDAHGVPIKTPDGLPTRRHIRSRPGDWFSRRVVAEDLDEIKRLYKDVGYPAVEISPQSPVDSEHTTIDITIPMIDLGPRVTIDHVEITGSPDVPDDLVRRALEISDGEVFNATKLDAARKRLLALRLFERVDIAYDVDINATTSRTALRVELTPRH